MAVSYKICSSTLQLSSTWPSRASVPCRNAEPLMCCQQSSQCLHAPFHPPQACLAEVPQKGHLIHCIQIHFQSWGEKQDNWTSLWKVRPSCPDTTTGSWPQLLLPGHWSTHQPKTPAASVTDFSPFLSQKYCCHTCHFFILLQASPQVPSSVTLLFHGSAQHL